ncbi:MAG: phosphoribosylamine--glycine ligase [Lentisphaeria bacterium]|nr:phosphoribosylamine--glycine ligase [Lentisphaeria bacterium]
MKILVLGSGGREHAICRSLKLSPETERLVCIPGSAGIAQIAECPADVPGADWAAIADYAAANAIDLVVIGPEAPLCAGAADLIRAKGIPVFGPSKAAAQLEGSKDFSKKFMDKYGIPTAAFATFDNAADARAYVNAQYDAGRELVVKADGLAAGKGVIVSKDRADALAAVDACFGGAFGAAGARVVLEELLVGEEASIFALVDGNTITALASSQDHKRQLDGDLGPNTGGMGAYSPAPVVTDELMAEVEKSVLKPFLAGIRAEGLDYRGLIYAGIMVTKDGPKMLEFNVRFGDPETEAVLPRLRSSLADALYKTAVGRLSEVRLDWAPDPCVCVVLASGEYPAGPIVKGHPISGIAEAEAKGAIVFHAGTGFQDGKFVNKGGRVLVVSKSAPTIQAAIDAVYDALAPISWENMQYRRDIAKKALKHLQS